jgi:D-sedoheptulose 7-phosphate isomerase
VTAVSSDPRAHLLASADVTRRAAESCAEAIGVAVARITDAFRAGGKLLLCGNGGSAADCQHMAAEFVSRLARDRDRPALPAVALTTDTSFLTAFANDVGFDGVFARQVEALGRRGDVLVAISTSGNSPNVVRAVEAAHVLGLTTIALTGSGGKLATLADVTIAVPAASIHHVQETHLAIEHTIAELVEREMFPYLGTTEA